MKRLLALLSFLVLTPLSAQAQEDADAGAELYDLHCAVCHGVAGRGNGPLAPALLLQPPELRTLAQRHGTFPTKRVVTRIDGRDPLVSHGSPMPIYGPFFEGKMVTIRVESGPPLASSQPIVDLVAYLKRIQE